MSWRLSAAIFAIILGACASNDRVRDTAQPEVARESAAVVEPAHATNSWPWPHESSDLPPDPSLTFGTLANGLRWVTMPGAPGDKHVSLRLIVHAGSAHEADGERGMAHFVEHMAFNGTPRFPGDSITEWFQRQGMFLSADVNATTSLYTTEFRIDLPRDDEAITREGLGILHDFASALSFDPVEVDAEKRVIDAEERERSSEDSIAWTTCETRLDPTARRVLRDPIGIASERARFDTGHLRAFHRRWYRPDNMTLVLAGPPAVLTPSLLERELGTLANPSDVCPRLEFEHASSLAGRSAFASKSSANVLDFRVRFTLPDDAGPRGREEMRRNAALDLACEMLSWKAATYCDLNGSPLERISARALHASAWDKFPYRGCEIAFLCDAARWEDALTWAACAVADMFATGFSPELLEGVRNFERGRREVVLAEIERRGTRARTTALAAKLASGEVATSDAAAAALYAEYVEHLDAESCRDALFDVWYAAPSIECIGNLEHGEELARKFASTWETATNSRKATPAVASAKPAITWSFTEWDHPEIARVVARPTSVAGIDEATLANGVRVLLRASDVEGDEVLVNVCIGSGTRGFKDRELAAAIAFPTALEELGLERMSARAASGILGTRRATFSTSLRPGAFTLSGKTNREDLLFQLQRLAAQLGEPGWREDGVQAIRRRFKGLDRLEENPLDFGLLSMRRQVLGIEARAEIVDADYAELTAQDLRVQFEPVLRSAPVTVILSGGFDTDQALANVNRTFGGLQPRAPRDASSVRGAQLGIVTGLRREHHIDVGVDKSKIHALFPVEITSLYDAAPLLTVASQIVAERMRIRLREKLGLTYGPTMSLGVVDEVTNAVLLDVECESGSGEEHIVLDACLAIIADLHRDGVTADEFTRARDPLASYVRGSERRNAFWAGSLVRVHSDPAALESVAHAAELFDAIKFADLEAFVRDWLVPERASTLIVRSKKAR